MVLKPTSELRVRAVERRTSLLPKNAHQNVKDKDKRLTPTTLYRLPSSFSNVYDTSSKRKIAKRSQNELSLSLPPPPPPRSTINQIYACTDEENDLAELRFDCDPDNNGTAQCFTEAGDANVEALEIHVSTERTHVFPVRNLSSISFCSHEGDNVKQPGGLSNKSAIR